MSCTKRQFMHTSALLASVALSAMLVSAASAADRFKVAFLASSSQNGYNKAIYDGIQAKAKELGNVDVEIFDGEFNATKQYSQVEDLVASKKFNAMIIVPNDTVGIANAVTDAVAAGLKVGTALFPIGPKLDTLEPQIPGLVTTVAYNPAVGAKAGADGLVKFCEGKDPCNTVIMIGQKIYPFDNLRYNTYLETLKPHANIKIVATVEGNYDPDKSMTGMQDVLQAHKDIVAILSNADQHLVGAEIALKDAGLDFAQDVALGRRRLADRDHRHPRRALVGDRRRLSRLDGLCRAGADRQCFDRQAGQERDRRRDHLAFPAAHRQSRARRPPRLQGRVAGLTGSMDRPL